MRPGQHLDCLGEVTVTSDRPVVVTIHASQFGEHAGVTRIGLRSRGREPFAITRRRQRVHRQHPIARCDQRADEQATIGFRRDRHLVGFVGVHADEFMETTNSLETLSQTRGSQPRTCCVFDEDVVMIFGPVMTDEHLGHHHLLVVTQRARGDQQLANGSVLKARHPTSHPRSTSPTRRRTI